MTQQQLPFATEPLHPLMPRWLPHVDARANLRLVHRDLYVGSAVAVLFRPGSGRDWWGAVDAHGPAHSEAFRREARFGELAACIRFGFEDGGPVPPALIEAAVGLARGRRGPLLICCAMGVSRSASVAYCVIRAETGATHEEALRAVSCPQGRPLPATLASARAWADARAARPADGSSLIVARAP